MRITEEREKKSCMKNGIIKDNRNEDNSKNLQEEIRRSGEQWECIRTREEEEKMHDLKEVDRAVL